MNIFDDVWFEKNPQQTFLFNGSMLKKKNANA